MVHEKLSLYRRFDGSRDIMTDPGDRGFSRYAQEAHRHCSGDQSCPPDPSVAMDCQMLARLGMLDDGCDCLF
jgi:hypothetical protein